MIEKSVCVYIYIYYILYKQNIQWFHSLSCGLIVTSIGTANFQTQPYFIPARKRIRRLLFEISDTQCHLKVAKVIQFWSNKKTLIGGLEHFLFFPIVGMMIQSDELIFFRTGPKTRETPAGRCWEQRRSNVSQISGPHGGWRFKALRYDQNWRR